MRPLRVMGLADSGKSLVCEDPSTGEQFSLDCDDRLRAGARGDLSRFGQLEIEMESQLRPREIQARIRAGASVEQVATDAGITVARVERYAYPVLQERASVVDRAVRARPAIDGITARASVADTVAATLSARGHDGGVRWDAFKDDDGWVLSLTWNAGRSENRAHWLFHPGADGGTLSARDEAAAEIVDPALRVLRPLRPVGHEKISALLDPTVPTELPATHLPAGPTHLPAAPAELPAAAALAPPAAHPAAVQPAAVNKAVVHPAVAVGERPGGRSSRFGQPSAAEEPESEAERLVEDTITDERSGVNPGLAHEEVARTGTDSSVNATPPARPAATTARSSRRGQRPTMPSWEDVLLGTKSAGR